MGLILSWLVFAIVLVALVYGVRTRRLRRQAEREPRIEPAVIANRSTRKRVRWVVPVIVGAGFTCGVVLWVIQLAR